MGEAQPIFSGNTGESYGISAVGIAVKSNSFVQLHVNNTNQIIPVKNLIRVSESEERFVEGASYSTLRHCAVSSLFKFSSNPIPEYAKSFDTRIVYQHDKDERLIKNDDDLFQALNFAVTENLMEDNNGVILNFWCRSINMCPKDISQSPLQVAIKAEMLVKLHVNDNGGITSITPLKNLVKYTTSSEGSREMACATRLRQSALSAFFKTASEKSLRNFGARIVYRSNGEDIPVNSDQDFTRVVEAAAFEYVPVLHLYCRMVDLTPRKKRINTLGSKGVGRMSFGHIEQRQSRTHQVDIISTEEMRNLQDTASAAADKVVNTMKCWISKVRHFVEENQEKKSYPDDFVKIPDPKKENDADPFDWGARFLHFLLLPELALDDTALARQGNDVFLGLLKNIASIVEESSARASDLIEHAIAIHTKGQLTEEKYFSSSSDESFEPALSNCSIKCSSINDNESNSIVQIKEVSKTFLIEPFDEAILVEGHDDESSDISSFEDVSEIEDDEGSWVIESD